MKKFILLTALLVLCCGCSNESEPQGPLFGEWELTHYGEIIDGNIEMTPSLGTHKIIFRNDTGREEYSDYYYTFNWSLLDDQLVMTNREPKTYTGMDILIDYVYHRSNKWTVLELTSDKLTVSCLMTHNSSYQQHTAVMTFEKVK